MAEPAPGAPAALAGRPLFEPFRALLARFGDPELPGADALDALLGDRAHRVCGGGGQPLRFVPATGPEPAGYEARIGASGEVPTRSGNWHDFFNALVWCVFPQAKRALNVRHLDEIRRNGTGGRGPIRDALTQFDECGVLVCSDRPELLDGLAAHRWEEVFWERREAVREHVAFLVFGHATLDALRTPFSGLCAKAVYREVGADWFALPAMARHTEADFWLAGWIAGARDLAPQRLRPLPVLAIPGLTADSETRAYYLDTRQFRPAPGFAPLQV